MKMIPNLGAHGQTLSGLEKTSYLVLTVMFALLTLVAATPAKIEQTATASVQNTITELIQVLDNEELQKPDRSEERRREIEQVVRQRVNYEEMAKRALGAPWSELNQRERREFVDLFVQLLRDRFAGGINTHSDEQVVFLSEHREEGFAEVKTRLTGTKVDTPLDFRLVNEFGHWLVYDVLVDGASIVSNYHAQFARIIRDYSYMGLVTKMKQKAFAVKWFEKTTPP
jgi:phospholipid transport system substrate-binding protein